MTQNSKREMRAAVNHGAKALEGLSDDAMDAIRQLMVDVRDDTLEIVEAGRAQMNVYSEQAEHAIHSRPFGAVAVGMGIGFMLGVMCARR
jgi:ElaB/YqjD/DUF883 family membrane-anchored ribosome-binding protein